jgi:hypothetical protein
VSGDTIGLDLPRSAPELTLRLRGIQARGVTLERQPLREAGSRAAFQSGAFYREGTDTLVAFDPPAGRRSLTLTIQGAA